MDESEDSGLHGSVGPLWNPYASEKTSRSAADQLVVAGWIQRLKSLPDPK